MQKIPFKAVAVDMDGTFVNSNNTYNKEHFREVLNKLTANGIHFIVASGRPIVRLRIDFKDFMNEVDMIADNGSILTQNNKVISSHYFTRATEIKFIRYIQENYPQASFMISSFDKGYLNDKSSAEFKKFMNFYYPDHKIMKDLTKVPASTRADKFTLWTDVPAAKIEKEFNHVSAEKIKATDSGFNCMDIIPYSVNKANGLKYFLRYFHIDPKEVIAFGDGMNDYEMLKLVGFSYAMQNADSNLKKIAKYEAPSNNEDGVLKVLDSYLN